MKLLMLHQKQQGEKGKTYNYNDQIVFLHGIFSGPDYVLCNVSQPCKSQVESLLQLDNSRMIVERHNKIN